MPKPPTLASPPGLLFIAAMFVALVTPWSISVSQAHAPVSFGFENPAFWLSLAAMLAAVFLPDTTIAAASLLAGDAVLVAFFAWASWFALTPNFTALGFPFQAIDLVGPGWFSAGVAELAVAAIVARRIHDIDAPPGRELWLLALVPGAALIRLGRTARGLIWMAAVSMAIFLASIDSPIGPLFQPVGGFYDIPTAPPTRSPEWILLGMAVGLVVLSVADTFGSKRRHLRLLS